MIDELHHVVGQADRDLSSHTNMVPERDALVALCLQTRRPDLGAAFHEQPLWLAVIVLIRNFKNAVEALALVASPTYGCAYGSVGKSVPGRVVPLKSVSRKPRGHSWSSGWETHVDDVPPLAIAARYSSTTTVAPPHQRSVIAVAVLVAVHACTASPTGVHHAAEMHWRTAVDAGVQRVPPS
jgi:hypothetical protein